MFHRESIIEYQLLFNDPKEYIVNIFRYHNLNSGFLDITDSYWNNLRVNLIIKLLSIFNIFSRCNFFINTIFFNFLIFFGSVHFFKIFIKLFPDGKIILLFVLFLMPSLIYFTSAIHKDGLIFLGLGITCYNLFLLIKTNYSLQRVLWVVVGLSIIFLIRNFVLITLLPAIAVWIVAEKNKKYLLPIYLLAYIFFIGLFFNLGSINARLNLPEYVAKRQMAFLQLADSSHSAININPLSPNFRSFVINSPQALNHTLLRPYPTEKFSLFYIASAIEILVYQLLFFLFLLFKSKYKNVDTFIYFGIFFSLTMFLMIGYTIPIIGAIVRYRSIYLPFLIAPILYYINWGKFKTAYKL